MESHLIIVLLFQVKLTEEAGDIRFVLVFPVITTLRALRIEDSCLIMNEDFEKWKEDWEENKEDYESDQAELYKRIRERNNLENRHDRVNVQNSSTI